MKQITAVAAMRMMVLTIVAAIAVAGVGDAQASSATSRSGTTSSSFKGGFSSQKKASSSSSAKKSSYDFGNSAKSDDSPAAGSSSGKTSFGSFSKSSDAGSAPSAADSAAPRSRSVFGRDLDKNAANANALRTMDARNAAKARQDSPVENGRQTAAGPAYSPPGQMQQAPAAPPVIIQNSGGGSSSPWMWFLLGQAMHGHDRERVIERVPAPVGGSSGSSGNSGTAAGSPAPVSEGSVVYDGSAAAKDAANSAPAAVREARPEPGFFMHTLRILFWLSILAAVGWGIYALAKRKGISKSTNYSLGKT
ncbi:MAG: hypothetical protein V4488_25730 [Pseudomonadota bacterium]